MAVSPLSSLSAYSVKKPRVQFYENPNAVPSQKWRWRLFMSSDEVAASSEGYSTKQLAIDNFKKIEQHIKYIRESLPGQLL